jgi:DNA-binding NarL/FixJ family response regulator
MQQKAPTHRSANQMSRSDSTANKSRPSRRELDVVRLLAEGNCSKQIAAILNLSTRTVETYRARIMNRLNVRSLAEVVRYAVRNGIVQA